MDDSQAKILEYCVKNCVFDGWTKHLLEDACKSAGLEANYWRIIFPGGVIDAVDAHTDLATHNMLENTDISGLRTPEKIRAFIKYRLEAESKNKEAVRSIMAVYALHPARGLNATYRIVDAIWRAAGDKSTDWNFYTKRLMLAGVYSSTLVHWLNDKSDGDAETWVFLDKRLEDVAKINKFKSNVKEFGSKVFS